MERTGGGWGERIWSGGSACGGKTWSSTPLVSALDSASGSQVADFTRTAVLFAGYFGNSSVQPTTRARKIVGANLPRRMLMHAHAE